MLDHMTFEEKNKFYQDIKKSLEIEKNPDLYDKNGNRIYKHDKKDYKEEKVVNYDELFLYVVTMLIGSMFNDRWLIWIAATIIYFYNKNKYNKK